MKSAGGLEEVKKVIIRHCSPVLMGCKPAALFTLETQNLALLARFLPPSGAYAVIREQEGRALVLLFDESLLEKTILDNPIRSALTGMGYPPRYSLPFFVDHLKKQFEKRPCPAEVGLFLGFPLDDVRGFIKYRGCNYKFCGAWKVYNDVERAKRCFRQYDLCRECMKRAVMR